MIGPESQTRIADDIFPFLLSSLTTELDTRTKTSCGCFTVQRTVLKTGQPCGFYLSTRPLASPLFLLFGPLLVPF